ncbi:MAG TPA: class I SAM-dependent methyltransferase [Pirellulaceae bacterium]|jgi:ubiquinone/menaquinone biosynthesis C-methylase UbiE
MGFYSQVIFPRICDYLLGQPFIGGYRKELLASAEGRILEIGFGTGLNLPHYPESVRRISTVDPNAGMHRLALRRIEQTGIEVDHHRLRGEALPFADGTLDCVVSTFTLCSVADPCQATSEIFRVLRPRGRFLFLEHGLSPEAAVQKWQRRMSWLQSLLGDGCKLDRNIKELVATQPYSAIDSREQYLEKMPKISGYVYRGMATK